MAVFVNDTEKILEYVDSWMLSGEWYQRPPQVRHSTVNCI